MSEHGNDVLGTGESPLDPARGDPECVEGSNGAPAATRTRDPRLRRRAVGSVMTRGYCREDHRCAPGRFAAGSGEPKHNPALSPITDLRASVCRQAGGLRGDDDRKLTVLLPRWRDADLHVVTERSQEVHQPLH